MLIHNKKRKLGAPALGLYNVRKSRKHKYNTISGPSPKVEYVAGVLAPTRSNNAVIRYIDYSASRIEAKEVSDIDEFLKTPQPEWATVRWIHVSNTDSYIVGLLQHHFAFHTLTAEDILHVPQRPRIEFFDDHLFVVLSMLKLETHEPNNTILDIEQVSLLLYDNVLLSFQEKPGDVWQSVRGRLHTENRRIRKNGTGYLLYALLDELVDKCFPVLEQYGDILEELEVTTLENPTPHVLHHIHSIKRELALLRRIVWPMREVIDHLYREEGGRIDDSTRPYLRDVYEHNIQIVEIIESYREMVSGLSELYMSAISNRMNEIMKVLTIISSVFIPLTFIAGIYGMNFKYMPELNWTWAYPVLWCVFILITTAMIFIFWRKGWLNRN
nr:magnesium/cobalt transporter CorA [Pseudoalteromonas sp. NGC95]